MVRVAYTMEQCWHDVPGGTGVAAIEVGRRLAGMDDLDIVGVAGRHRRPPATGFEPPMTVAHLPLGGPLLYHAWLRASWPRVESVVPGASVVHATTVIPAATDLPLVATVHDLAFLRHPEFFTRNGNAVFRRSLSILRRRASLLLCSSRATIEDCRAAGFPDEMLRLVPLGVERRSITDDLRSRLRATYELPERFVLFVGTLEPRKNLERLVAAMSLIKGAPPLVVAGMKGWGDAEPPASQDVRLIGYVPHHLLPALYEASTVFALPSILEGYGLPVAEAMAHGTAVVTSRGTSTEEVAGGAAVLVDPLDVESIAVGIREAIDRRVDLVHLGAQRAAELTWDATAALTRRAYAEVTGNAPTGGPR